MPDTPTPDDMNDDLDRRIRDLVSRAVSDAPEPPDVDPTVTPIHSDGHGHRSWWIGGAFVATAAAALIAVFALIGPGDETVQTPATEPVTPPTTEPPPLFGFAPADDPRSSPWTLIEYDEDGDPTPLDRRVGAREWQRAIAPGPPDIALSVGFKIDELSVRPDGTSDQLGSSCPGQPLIALDRRSGDAVVDIPPGLPPEVLAVDPIDARDGGHSGDVLVLTTDCSDTPTWTVHRALLQADGSYDVEPLLTSSDTEETDAGQRLPIAARYHRDGDHVAVQFDNNESGRRIDHGPRIDPTYWYVYDLDTQERVTLPVAGCETPWAGLAAPEFLSGDTMLMYGDCPRGGDAPMLAEIDLEGDRLTSSAPLDDLTPGDEVTGLDVDDGWAALWWAPLETGGPTTRIRIYDDALNGRTTFDAGDTWWMSWSLDVLDDDD